MHQVQLTGVLNGKAGEPSVRSKLFLLELIVKSHLMVEIDSCGVDT